MDITELILTQHHEQRRGFAMLDDVARDDVEALAAIWSRLEVLLEVHADAEERFFYPRLLEVGTGVGDADGPDEEVEDAVSDHNEIRDGIRKVRAAEPGSDQWWDAVRECREANSDHMAEEEREDLPDFRRNADLQLRHDIAVQFLAYEGRHAEGVEPVDKDPEEYVRSGGCSAGGGVRRGHPRGVGPKDAAPQAQHLVGAHVDLQRLPLPGVEQAGRPPA